MLLPLGSWNTFVDGIPVRLKGSPGLPAVEVAPVSLMADGMVPSSTPRLSCDGVSPWARLLRFCFAFSHFRQRWLMLVPWLIRQVVLSLSW